MEFAAPMRVHFSKGNMAAGEWCMRNLSDLGLRASDREALRLELYDALLKAQAPDVRARTLDRLLTDKALSEAVSVHGLEERILQFISLESDSTQRRYATFQLASKLLGSEDPEVKCRGRALLHALLSQAE